MKHKIEKIAALPSSSRETIQKEEGKRGRTKPTNKKLPSKIICHIIIVHSISSLIPVRYAEKLLPADGDKKKKRKEKIAFLFCLRTHPDRMDFFVQKGRKEKRKSKDRKMSGRRGGKNKRKIVLRKT